MKLTKSQKTFLTKKASYLLDKGLSPDDVKKEIRSHIDLFVKLELDAEYTLNKELEEGAEGGDEDIVDMANTPDNWKDSTYDNRKI